MGLPPFDYPVNSDDPEELARINAELEAAMASSDPYANQPTLTSNLIANNPANALGDSPDDATWEHGVSYKKNQNDLRGTSYDAVIKDNHEQGMRAQQSALDMLSQALNNQPEITAQQGLAAALLAAIPALGGKLIGNAVGNPKIPAGTYFPGMSPQAFNKEFGVGGNALAAQASNIGGNIAGDYLTGLYKEDLAKTPILEKQAAIYAQEANQAYSREDQARLGQASAQEQAARQDDQQAFLHKEKSVQDVSERLLPEDQKAIAVALGLDPNQPRTTAQMRVITQAFEAARRERQGDIKLAGENLTVPSNPTKEQMAEVISAKTLGERYLNKINKLAEKDPSYLERNIGKAFPADEFGQLQKELGLFAVQIRNARESGVMTEPDYQRYLSYLTIGPLDTMGSLRKRFEELLAVTDISGRSILQSAKAGRENVSAYEELLGYKVPTKPAESYNPPGQPDQEVAKKPDPLGIR